MPRDFRQSLQDILEAIAKIERYVVGLDLEHFKRDDLRIDAINMNLIIIGEAANAVPEAIQQRYPNVDWRNIVGLRNVITHEYFRLNLDRIWNVVEVELPRLKQHVERILAAENTDHAEPG